MCPISKIVKKGAKSHHLTAKYIFRPVVQDRTANNPPPLLSPKKYPFL